ncbi:MAG: hypothetical protein HC828_05710 [Blastochloris sp.]|nr:hypothetical protein [Blastochloris sp.]
MSGGVAGHDSGLPPDFLVLSNNRRSHLTQFFLALLQLTKKCGATCCKLSLLFSRLLVGSREL